MIKTKLTCGKCKYGYWENCNSDNCLNCKMFTTLIDNRDEQNIVEKPVCRCALIQIGDDCEYFEELDESIELKNKPRNKYKIDRLATYSTNKILYFYKKDEFINDINPTIDFPWYEEGKDFIVIDKNTMFKVYSAKEYYKYLANIDSCLLLCKSSKYNITVYFHTLEEIDNFGGFKKLTRKNKIQDLIQYQQDS